jgi:hypothetical protein
MKNERWNALMNDKTEQLNLTDEEIAEGWHWCAEWDGLLVGPGMMELQPCTCLDKDHPARKVPLEFDASLVLPPDPFMPEKESLESYVKRLETVIEELKSTVGELEATFDLRHKADIRGVNLWRTAHPERILFMPDHADMVFWMMEHIDLLLKGLDDAIGQSEFASSGSEAHATLVKRVRALVKSTSMACIPEAQQKPKE